MADTVDHALATPDRPPCADPDEVARLAGILGRRPTDSEVALARRAASVATSLRFGQAGPVEIGGGLAVSLAVGPDGSALRRTLAAGARPVARMTTVRVGSQEPAAGLPSGDIGRVAEAGNVRGVATLGVRVGVDAVCPDAPFAMSLVLGTMRSDAVAGATTPRHPGDAGGPSQDPAPAGSPLSVRDGAGGDAVAVGDAIVLYGLPAAHDPFADRLLIDATADLRASALVRRLADIGDGGLGPALSSLSAPAGAWIHLAAVAGSTRTSAPPALPASGPEQVIADVPSAMMLAAVHPADVTAILDVCRRWGLVASAIGEIVEAPRLAMDWNGERVVDIAGDFLTGHRPREFHRPPWIDEVNSRRGEDLPRPALDDIRDTLVALLTTPQLCDRTWANDRVNSVVGGNTVLAGPVGAGMVRVDETTGRGVGAGVAGNARFALLNPYLGAQSALLEAYRDVAATGARPVAVVAAPAVGGHDDPALAWQAVELGLGLTDACRGLGLTLVAGEVLSRDGVPAPLPVPNVAVVGVIDDVATRVGPHVAYEGDAVLLVGSTGEHLSGSVWADVAHAGHLGGMPPPVDLHAHRRLANVLTAAGREGLLSSAIGLGEGGLAAGLVRMCLGTRLGVALTLPGADPFVSLVSESAGRVLVSLSGVHLGRFGELCDREGTQVVRLGEVIEAPVVEIQHVGTIELDAVTGPARHPVRTRQDVARPA